MQQLPFKDRRAFRKWLKEHGADETGLWLVLYKKGANRATISYDEAVEEALCFGWIDSVVNTIDAESHRQKFTPRGPKSSWSKSNLERIEKLIAAQQMTAAGLKVVPDDWRQRLKELRNAEAIPKPSGPPQIPADVKKAIVANSKASAYFKTLPPGYLRTTLKWIDDAKREETRARRIKEFVAITARSERIGVK
jgi:uncharacterized protein YdeI (YjbR/CyaY-like superfamily)